MTDQVTAASDGTADLVAVLTAKGAAHGPDAVRNYAKLLYQAVAESLRREHRPQCHAGD